MIVYNKEDRNFKIPNGIGNLNITINEDETTLTEELLKINSEIENINEDIDVLEGRIIDLENNGGGNTPDLSNYATTQYVDEELLKVNNEIETINEDIDVLEGKVFDLKNSGLSVVRIVAMDEILSVNDFNRIYHNTNNELFELEFRYSKNNNIKIFTILTKEWDSSTGIRTIICFDFTQRYKFWTTDDTIVYMESSPISNSTE